MCATGRLSDNHTPREYRAQAPELACRLANVEWAIIAARLPWTTHTARIRELEAAGVVPDDANFDRMAAGVPR